MSLRRIDRAVRHSAQQVGERDFAVEQGAIGLAIPAQPHAQRIGDMQKVDIGADQSLIVHHGQVQFGSRQVGQQHIGQAATERSKTGAEREGGGVAARGSRAGAQVYAVAAHQQATKEQGRAPLHFYPHRSAAGVACAETVGDGDGGIGGIAAAFQRCDRDAVDPTLRYQLVGRRTPAIGGGQCCGVCDPL